ncbi:MAG: ribosome maturation factor RimM [Flavobacteriales bacterium]|nr:ribosome maturation factor RimM [Flavobacteriales bacterium]
MSISHKDCFNLGHIAKTKGFKGELSLFLDVDNPNNYQTLDRVLIDLGGVLTPFFISSIRVKNNSFADLRLEGVENKDDAVRLSGKEVFLPMSDLPELPDDEYYLHDLEGMEVIDFESGSLGKVSRVIDHSNNPLLEIIKGKTEILIPIHDEFIQTVDKKKLIIQVNLPEGLIEVNKK